MSAWDPWWVHGDYAETYHGAPDEHAEFEAWVDELLNGECPNPEEDDD